MNRLILLGNGFDLSHGLKTSYNDFIIWYLKKVFIHAFNKRSYEDALLNITYAPSNITVGFTDVDEIAEMIYELYRDNDIKSLIENKAFSLQGNLINGSPFEVTVKSNFIRSLLHNCSNERWVDIEDYFYEHLKMILTLRESPVEKEKKLHNLNLSMKCLISNLSDYLQKLNSEVYLEPYWEFLQSHIRKIEVYDGHLDTNQLQETLILNFNYTNTVERYLSQFQPNAFLPLPVVNSIHGELNSSSNPPVFGFGDELDDYYLLIEKEKAKGYFHYIKSFWYFKTSNYRNLVNFIDANEYQVCIMGHSCGLSDRTMLHMVFEHTNCKSILIYYHTRADSTNNYEELTHEIARHFKDKENMRKKIVPFNLSFYMPQAPRN